MREHSLAGKSEPTRPRDPTPPPDDTDAERPRLRPTVRRGSKPGDRRIRVGKAPDVLVHKDQRDFLVVPAAPPGGRIRRWLLRQQTQTADGEPLAEQTHAHPTHPWWKVMCLTGVDYFSTLGYQPGIAVLAAGTLAPLATLILVLVTLFGALPIYRRVAQRSPHGEGSLGMLERLLPWWQGKLFILCLLGFAATDFIITITLSAADATAHIIENPFMPDSFSGQRVLITLILIAALCLVFLRGFNEAIGIAVGVVVVYLLLNVVVVVAALEHVIVNPHVVSNWQDNLFVEHDSVLLMIGVSLMLFPKLALGLSGFETGVAVMPLVKGDPSDTEAHPAGRVRGTRRLLTTAALIMSVFLLTSSFTTTVLIEPEAFEEGGEANGRALAYLAHTYLGDGFGTIYDISTILILWFAGASAMAGLLNLVPRYLPRYGMAPDWALAIRPLVLVFTGIAVVVTILFRADVDAQGGAYATGVLVLMTSAAFAVMLAYRRAPRHTFSIFVAITLVFAYTTLVNVFERPDGVKIAAFFIAAIVITSLVSRVFRSTELRTSEVVLDETASRWLAELPPRPVRIIAHHPDARSQREYVFKLHESRTGTPLPPTDPLFFLEVTVRDASDFAPVLRVHGEQIGEFRVLRVEAASVANAIAAFLLYLRDRTGQLPHVYFGWIEGNPLKYLARFILFGEGDIAPLTHEVLRRAEPDVERRPVVHVG